MCLFGQAISVVGVPKKARLNKKRLNFVFPTAGTTKAITVVESNIAQFVQYPCES